MAGKIFVVEDNKKDVEFLQVTLAKEKYTVIHAPDGKTAFEMLEKNQPDIIILDLLLPDMDGFEICKRLRAEERFLNIPILFFTSSINMDNKLLGLQLGASDFLGKGCDERELLLRIRNLLSYKKQYDEMARLSVIDSLTHVYNRRYFKHRLMDEFERGRRYIREFCCMIIDVDNFKSINDTYGHLVGDDALRHVAAILRRNTRAADVLCRYGGDEFGLLLPETNFPGAFVTAERMRVIVEKTAFTKTDKPGKITLSFGISSLIEGGALGMDELVTQADVALYQAKRGGRNRISFYGRK
ncbi:MAG: diguanylate cyclase [Candidatus Omnitrophica bacterium]|nr:diguanylate cyclase [Candidatus Omnitrophota bacterium]